MLLICCITIKKLTIETLIILVINGRIMKAVILAGGKGTRFGEGTRIIPKPMISIKGLPMLVHIMKIFSNQGINNFIIALGYKSEIIENYFTKNKYTKKILLKKKGYQKIELKIKKNIYWNIELIYTGKNTLTGGRVRRLKKYLKDEKDFFVTYGDGLGNINLKKLIKFHKQHNKIGTVTAVRPPARFGVLNIKKEIVTYFKEKPQVASGWINGGFFIFKKKFFKFLKNDKTILESKPLEKLSKLKQLSAFKHFKFWHCMDTVRDKESLEEIFSRGLPYE